MRRIWKYPLSLTRSGRTDVDLPCGATILSVVVMGNRPTLYALVDSEVKETRRHKVRIYDTGEPVVNIHDLDAADEVAAANMQYQGTLVLESPQGDYVGHAFVEVL